MHSVLIGRGNGERTTNHPVLVIRQRKQSSIEIIVPGVKSKLAKVNLTQVQVPCLTAFGGGKCAYSTLAQRERKRERERTKKKVLEYTRDCTFVATHFFSPNDYPTGEKVY